MRLLKYLNESIYDEDTIKNINENIHKDCQPYLKLIKGQFPVYRAIEHRDVPVIWDKIVRKDRIPRGTNTKLFKMINDILKKNGHNSRAESVMVSSNMSFISSMFGTPFYFFPVGKFSYSWIKAKDFNMDDTGTRWKSPRVPYKNYEKDYSELKSQEFTESLEDSVLKYVTTDKGFTKASLLNQYEIWFNCKKYHLVSNNINWNHNTQEFIWD